MSGPRGEPAADAAAQRPIAALPPALERLEEIAGRVGQRRPVFFLDYDGTLTPIVDRPEDAHLPEATRELLRQLGARHTVALVSGRDLEDLRARVGLEGLVYAGSHGLELTGPGGWRHAYPPAQEARPALERAAQELADALASAPGLQLERKGFALAVHFRRAPASSEDAVRAAVERVCGRHPALRVTGGRKIFELRPDVPWDKGRALGWILERLGLEGPDVCPLYVGDDLTDEDALRFVEARGVGVLVRGREGDRTHARWTLEDPGAVRRFLATLAERLR